MQTFFSDIVIRLYPHEQRCQICGVKTNLLKTERKNCYSFNLRKFVLITGSTFCPSHKYFDSEPNKIIKYHSELAMLIVDKKNRICFDLIVKIGRLRYEEHRQLEEIQSYLKCSSAKINLPISTIGMIAKRFLEFCHLLHKKNEMRIRNDIAAHGGYFLHFDGTTEKKCDKCNLLIMDSRCGHVLESSMIESENYATIKKSLLNVRSRYGDPLVTISDLKSGFLKACTDVFGTKSRHIFCHYHFLKTFKDDFIAHHQLIKTYLGQKLKLKSAIEKLLENLNHKESKPIAQKVSSIDEIEQFWRATSDTLSTYRYVLQWMLKFRQDSYGKGVPFDLPFLDFYNRVTRGMLLIDKIFQKGPPTYRLKYYKLGCYPVVENIRRGGEEGRIFRNSIRNLEYLKKWFTKLRASLFLQPCADDSDSQFAPLSRRYNLSEEEAKSIPKRLSDYIQDLEKERSCCKNTERKSMIERFKKQVEKYQKNLHVPILPSHINGKKRWLIPPRTNNCMESFFRSVKSVVRRCTGRSKLSKEFASIGALLPYYLSMKDNSIFFNIFNDDRILCDEFAKLFIHQWTQPKK